MKVITYRITLLEPTLVTALDGDPNSAVAFSYLPGSVLRGAVIGKYLRQQKQTELDIAQPDVRRLFFDATTRYLNGYRLDRLNIRTLPTPASWQRQKGNERDIVDFAIEPPDDDAPQWQGIGEPFCTFTDNEVRLVQSDRHITVHTARNRRFGRAMPREEQIEPPGAVYRYDALAAGQTFEAAILCDHETDVATLLPLLTGEVTLGGSRSSGYGRAKLENSKECTDWREIGGTLLSDVDGKLITTFLSDVLLRDGHGQFVVDPNVVTAALSARLGVLLRLQHAFLRGQAVGGFNRKWGLPLPQMLAIEKGSVFVYDTPSCDESRLKALEASGIGERRAEGFGRIAINWQTEATLQVDTTATSPTLATVIIPSGSPSVLLAQRMAERMLRQRLDERLLATANGYALRNPPSNAQLSRLRNVIHNELMQSEPNPQRIGEFLNNVRQRNTARKQYERARVGSEHLVDWLERTRQITSENEWKTLIGLRSDDSYKVGGVEARLTEALRTEYVLRFIDAVLARAAKAQRQEVR
jgi:CRISPR-associated protein Csx10